MEEIPNLPMRKDETPAEHFEAGRRYGLWEAEKVVDKIDSHRWLHDNFLKRQDRGCMDEEAFVFTLEEIKKELKEKLNSQTKANTKHI